MTSVRPLASGALARAADQEGGDGGGNRDDGPNGDIQTPDRNDERHADGHEHQRRGAIQHVDQVALEVAVHPAEPQKARLNEGTDDE